jgi:hypothetical protein
MIAYLPTATAMCPACHNGPCNDGTLCDSSRRGSWAWIEIGPALREPPFGATVKEIAEYSNHPRHQNQPPRSPRPGIRKGRR